MGMSHSLDLNEEWLVNDCCFRLLARVTLIDTLVQRSPEKDETRRKNTRVEWHWLFFFNTVVRA